MKISYLLLLLFLGCRALNAQENIFNIYEHSGYINVGVYIDDRNDEVILIKDFYGYRNVIIDSIKMVHIYRRGGMIYGFQTGFGTGFIYGALAGAVGGLFLKNNQPGTTDVEFKVLAIAGSALASSAAMALAGGVIGAVLNIGSSIDEQYIFTDMDMQGKLHMLDQFIEYQKTGRRGF